MRLQELINVTSRCLRYFSGGSKKSATLRRCLNMGLMSGAVTFIAIYFLLRDREYKLTVHLAKVHFQKELPQTLEAQGQLKAIPSWKVMAEGPVRVDRLTAKNGDEVKKDQVIVITDEVENRRALAGTLEAFNRSSRALTAAKKAHRSGKLSSKALKEVELQFEKSKGELQTATRKVEMSLIHSPADGRLWMKAELGQKIVAGAEIAEVENDSKFGVLIEVAVAQAKELPSQCRAKVAFKEDKPVDVEASIHYASARLEPASEKVGMQVVFSSNEIPANWRHEMVSITLMMPPLKNVALVERSALVSHKKDSRILVLTASGTMHWHKLANPRFFKDQLVFTAVNPDTFRVVRPEDIESLNKAITLNARPRVQDG